MKSVLETKIMEDTLKMQTSLHLINGKGSRKKMKKKKLDRPNKGTQRKIKRVNLTFIIVM